MTDKPRLIEYAFPLKQTSLDSVHEKNVRHGHISTLHIWPARRPLAACRAALIATLLPDPGDAEKRKELCEKIAGRVVKRIERKKMPNGQTVDRVKEETEGGILHWGRETENAETLQWFREEIKKAYGGRAPKVLDPFAGGGAIPLEAMRLGCEVTAVDINPVAWFILKCTLEYPQKLAGQTRPLPEFILDDDAFMAEFFKRSKGYGKAEIKAAIKRLHDRLKKTRKLNKKSDQGSFQFQQDGGEANELHADLAWHVRAWGQWVLGCARRELAQYYPTYADFEPITKDHIAYERQPMRLVPVKEDGTPDIDGLNAEFTEEYLDDKRNPRWVAKPTVGYLWARTVACKNCRARVPLLKTCWLSKKANKRTLLTMTPNADKSGVVYAIENNIPARGGNAAQNREHDKRMSAGTMSRAGAKCPCCGAIMTMDDIRVEGRNGNLSADPTAVMVAGPVAREYRVPTDHERIVVHQTEEQLAATFSNVPFGIPNEPTPAGGGRGAARAFSIQSYGQFTWRSLFTPRQLVALGTLCRVLRDVPLAIRGQGFGSEWGEAVTAYCAAGFDRLLDRCSTQCQPDPTPAQSGVLHTFHRFAFPVVWDFIEGVPIEDASGGFLPSLEWAAKVAEHTLAAAAQMPRPECRRQSAVNAVDGLFDLVVTDPPYYDAIPYSDLMDFFYVWLRRNLYGLSESIDAAFSTPASPKWDHTANDGELIDDETRHGGDAARSKAVYEDGMFRAFQACNAVLTPTGRMVVVFANKQPDAWETLVAAIIRAGFVVDGSWPIMTEMSNRMRALAGAALASSVWLACRKRDSAVRPGWDNQVLEEMRKNIAVKLREFWDAGIRGPDFVWAATGPALEAYSKHPVIRKANEPKSTMGVGEFLTHVRRMVVDYIVGQVLTGERGSDLAVADRLDEVTAYYLLHRHDFGMEEAPVGACILYATACGLSDSDLERTWDVLSSSGKTPEDQESVDEEDQETGDSGGDESEGEASSGGKVKLKPWNQRRGKSLGHEAPQGKAVPLIDRIHRVMHLWKDGDVHKVDEYLDQHALRRHELFKRVVQSLIELSTNSERSLLESISNHIGAKGAKPAETMPLPGIASTAEREDE